MDWDQLISNTRLGCEGKSDDGQRNSYYRDFDRIIFSKEFRMLQTKTQVVPFPETDATHTRLTHSLETASVGRSLGINVGIALNEIGCSVNADEFGAIVSAACLCHDIGNPPLGHSGENAIAQYFKDEKGHSILNQYVDEDHRYDFEHFEGNAMGFHLLTNSDQSKTSVTGGFGLTYATLGAFVKYPNRQAIYEKGTTPKHFKKSGLFRCDLELFDKIASALGIVKLGVNTWCRHPLAFLTEASDDICYAIIDLEDGYRNGLVAFKKIKELLIAVIHEDPQSKWDGLAGISDETEQIGYLRAKAINALINLCVKAFVDNRNEILDGSFKSSLIDAIPQKANEAYKAIKKVEEEHIYTHKNILLTEAAGFVVLPGLLDLFINSAFTKNSRSQKIRDCILKGMIVDDTSLNQEERNYKTIMNIVEYVALMTDNYAVKLYRELNGIQLPNY